MNTSEYHTWCEMRARCRNKKHKYYFRYGGRGITVCHEWDISFARFLQDMGLRPSREYSLERRDNDKGYDKDNCYWATRRQQNRNRRNTVMLTFNNKTQSLGEWAEEYNHMYWRVSNRLKRGWSIK